MEITRWVYQVAQYHKTAEHVSVNDNIQTVRVPNTSSLIATLYLGVECLMGWN
jgi:hypothetical protein